ncbi:MAG: GTPase HflX [Actinomycetes bacterium]
MTRPVRTRRRTSLVPDTGASSDAALGPDPAPVPDPVPVLAPGDGEQRDLADRQSLRRVPGLSTELVDVTEVEYRQLRLERVVLAGVWTQGSLADAESSMRELAALATTAGSQVLDGLIQRRDTPDAATYIGSGKAQLLREVVLSTGADTVVFDGELTPGQLVHLEDLLKVKVVDRTALILDIFAQHARSREGKAQVELAQLQYLLPRLRGWGQAMSRTGGGIGTRGPGETKIETDRRRIRSRVSRLRREIAGMGTARATARHERDRHAVPSVVIVGYTNAGKSSLLNRLTGAGVLVEDALFATLDPKVRRSRTADGRVYTITDTVGFVRHLPHQLVEAFRSTLEEVAEADLVVHVVDAAQPDPDAQFAAVREVLAEVGAGPVPELVVLNKADLVDPAALVGLRATHPASVAVSTRTGEGIAVLRAALDRALPRLPVEVHVLLGFDQGRLVARVHRDGQVLAQTHTAQGTLLHVRVDGGLAAELEAHRLVPVE